MDNLFFNHSILHQIIATLIDTLQCEDNTRDIAMEMSLSPAIQPPSATTLHSIKICDKKTVCASNANTMSLNGKGK